MQQLNRFEPVYSFLDYAFVCGYLHDAGFGPWKYSSILLLAHNIPSRMYVSTIGTSAEYAFAMLCAGLYAKMRIDRMNET